MKKSFLFLFILGLVVTLPIRGQATNTKAEAAIKSVIEGEIKASFDGDYNTWVKFFVHEPYVLWMQESKEVYSCWKGWQEISTSMKNYVKPERKGTMIHNGNSDYIIKLYGNEAFVTFKCKSTKISNEQSTPVEAWEARFLENQSGSWKITYLSSVYTSTYK